MYKNMFDLFCVYRNLEKEISFDFGPTAEFAYLYSQCYELTTSEYVHLLLIIIIRARDPTKSFEDLLLF